MQVEPNEDALVRFTPEGVAAMQALDEIAGRYALDATDLWIDPVLLLQARQEAREAGIALFDAEEDVEVAKTIPTQEEVNAAWDEYRRVALVDEILPSGEYASWITRCDALYEHAMKLDRTRHEDTVQ